MLERLFGPKLDNLNLALDRSSKRQSLLTANLANVNTPGYKRRDLDFNLALDELSQTGDTPAKQAMRDRVVTQSGTRLRQDGNNVDLEREVFAIAETEMRYQVLTDLTNRYFSGLKNAIREGRQ